jgi:nucleotide sugar dehydrogenase
LTEVAIIGLGYVGQALASRVSKVKGFSVIGVEKSKSVLLPIMSDDLGYPVTSDINDAKNADVFIVCVATPLSGEDYVAKAAQEIASVAKKGALAILESTVGIGVTEKIFFPPLTKAGVLVAYSPERIDPGSEKYNISNTTKVVSGATPLALKAAMAFYTKFIKKVVSASDVRVAEAAKLLENSYRLLNVSFVNEFARSCLAAGIDSSEVIQLASTKEFGFQAFYPSAGAGGHCIPVDPEFLSNYMRELGVPITLLETAIEINDSMPNEIVDDLNKKFNGLQDKKILIVGMSYKANTDDTRNSSGSQIYNLMKHLGYDVKWHDEVVKTYGTTKSVKPSNSFDVVLVTVRHEELHLSMISESKIVSYA